MIENFYGFGTRIQQKLNEMNITQSDLWRQTGMSKNAISNYISENRVPDTMAAYKLSKFFNVTIEWLLTGEAPGVTANAEAEKLSESELIEKAIYRLGCLGAADQEDIYCLIEMKYRRTIRSMGDELSVYPSGKSATKAGSTATNEAV